jgi:hypothetical protein
MLKDAPANAGAPDLAPAGLGTGALRCAFRLRYHTRRAEKLCFRPPVVKGLLRVAAGGSACSWIHPASPADPELAEA